MSKGLGRKEMDSVCGNCKCVMYLFDISIPMITFQHTDLILTSSLLGVEKVDFERRRTTEVDISFRRL